MNVYPPPAPIPGKGTKLDPPITIDGTTYGYAVALENQPALDTVGRSVVSAKVFSVDGSKVVFERGLQFASFIIPPEAPGRGATEVQFAGRAGGNVCNSPEPRRVYSRFNGELAARGSVASMRAIPGDGLLVKQGSKQYLLEITSAVAYGTAPASVNYVAIDDLRQTLYMDAPGPGLGVDFDALPPSARFELLTVRNDGVDMERRIYTRPIDEVADPAYLPDNAQLEADQYWWDETAGAARFSHALSASAPLTLFYWVFAPVIDAEPADSLKESRTSVVNIEDSNFSFGGFVRDTDDFDVSITIFGAGTVLAVAGTGTGDRGLYVRFDDAGNVVTRARVDQAGLWSSALFSGVPSPVTFPAAVRLRRDGTRYRVDIDGTTVLDVADGFRWGSLIGVGGSVAWLVNSVEDLAVHRVNRTDGELGVLRVDSATAGDTGVMIVPAGFTVRRVDNLTTGQQMASTGTARNTFEVSGGNVLLRRIQEGDQIRVSLTRTGPTPSGPGRPFPTVAGQVNFSTPDLVADPDGSIATTDVSENIANWHDHVIVDNPLGITISAGDTVEVIRGRGFAPSWATAVVEIDTPDDESSDWVAVDPADFLFLRYEGILLLSEDLTLPSEFCVRLTLSGRYRQAIWSEYFNELRDVVRVCDDLWADPGGVGGPGFDFSGSLFQQFGPSAYELRTHGGGCKEFYPVDWVTGLSRALIHASWVYSGESYLVPAGKMGYFEAPNSYRDLILRTAPAPNVQTVIDEPPCPVVQWNTHRTYVEGEGAIALNLFGKGNTGFSAIGSPAFVAEDLAGGVFGARLALVDIRCARLDVGRLIGRLPRNSTIVEALMPVLISDLEVQRWQWEGAVQATGAWNKITVNGGVTRWEGTGAFAGNGPPPGWVPDTPPEYVNEGELTLDAFAVRYDSERVYILNNPAQGELILPRKRILSGAGFDLSVRRTLVRSGEWAMVDVTRLFRSLLRLVDSKAQEFYIAPSAGNPTSEANEDTLAAFLQGAANSTDMTASDQFPDPVRISGTAEGIYYRWTDIQVGKPLIRYRIGGDPTVYSLPFPGAVDPAQINA